MACFSHWSVENTSRKKDPLKLLQFAAGVCLNGQSQRLTESKAESLCGVKVCMDSIESACLNVQEQHEEPNSVLGSIDFVLGICKCQTH